jgi:anti-sigma factor RsiW
MTDHVNIALGAYVLGALAPSEQAAVERHLARCRSCAAGHAELAGLPALLDVAAGQAPPPDRRVRVRSPARVLTFVTRRTSRR